MEVMGSTAAIEAQNERPVAIAGPSHNINATLMSSNDTSINCHDSPGITNSPSPAVIPGAAHTGQQSTVFQRLQALFPGSPTINAPSSPTSNLSNTPQLSGQNARVKQGPQALKVKIVTWNMHDSLPKGNLEELLGKVPLYIPTPKTDKDASEIPDLPPDDVHPYHVVIVAGQECPTSSGIPMGLGAALNNIIEREKSKEKDKDKDKDKDKEKEIKRHKSNKSTSGNKENLYRKSQDQDDSNTPSTEMKQSKSEGSDEKEKYGEAHPTPTSGWSAILESWFCNAIGSDPSSSRTSVDHFSSSNPTVNSDHPHHIRHLGHLHSHSKELNGHPYNRQKSPTPPLGPYELLIKERLMGIYLAVFIHREIKPLVRGTDKSAVAAGLIGGRVGNKGGVAISINLNGLTFLFVNAHLAAHEGKTQHRMQNLAKIKAELEIEDFLSENDPRSKSEDLTDKFDYTFIFGDLNFRLNVTRLHADWLISRQDYEQALCFDQLRQIMQKGEAFVGFSEAPIDFPPTFKYDVLRTIKGSKRSKGHDGVMYRRNPELSEVDEKANEEHSDIDEAADIDEQADVNVDISETTSITSRSTATSIQSSRRTTTTTDIDDDEYDYFGSPFGKSKKNRRKSVVHDVAEKAKNKWLALISPSSPSLRPPLPSAPSFSNKDRPAFKHASHSTAELEGDMYSPPKPSSMEHASVTKKKERPKSLSIRRSDSSVRILRKKKSEPEDNDEDNDKGVYDTSSKKRVPSWCDRILWKSTVQLSIDEDVEIITEERIRSRPRVVSFLAQALRPRSRLSLLFSSASSSNGPPLLASGPTDLILSSSATQELLASPSLPPSATKHVDNTNVRVRYPKLYLSKSVEPSSSDTDLSTRLSMQKDPAPPQRSRSFSVTIVPRPSHWSPTTEGVNHSLPTEEPMPMTTPNISDGKGLSSRNNSPKWWLPPFFSNTRDFSPNIDTSPTITGDSIKGPRPRRGQVIPLGYGTLDDHAMRRLEGRSDHRPVIGSYAIYI